MLCVVSKRGIGALVEQGIETAGCFAKIIAGHPAFELVGAPQINILNYRYIPRGLRRQARYSLEENRLISQAVVKIQERQFIRGNTFVSRTDVLNDNYCAERIAVFRVVIANPLTTQQDLLDTLADQLEIAEQVCP
jgi:aspartate 1-decarboxylase